MKADRAVMALLASVPAGRRPEMEVVRKAILASLPKGYEEAVVGKTLVYQVPLAVYPDTYNGHPLWYVALANQKNYLSLYLMMCYGESALLTRLRAGFKAAGKKLDMGKSCVRFQRAADLPLEVIREVIGALPPTRWVAIAKAARAR